MRSILQSIRPQYCGLIAAGKKAIEIRKTKPKLDVPFKVYIYCTKDKLLTKSHNNGNIYPSENKYKSALEKAGNLTLSGKVIGEYVCDKIIEYPAFQLMDAYIIPFLQQSLTCLTQEELWQYGKGKTLYGWHISDLKIYDKPKELSEFEKAWRNSKGEYHDIRPCQNGKSCMHIYFDYQEYTDACKIDFSGDNCPYTKLTRPPQSWCYVEEV